MRRKRNDEREESLLRNEDRRPQKTEAEGPAKELLLSLRWAFVVQFRTSPVTVSEHFAGQMEHIASSHAVRFHSSEELVSFLKQILADMETPIDGNKSAPGKEKILGNRH